MQGLYAIVDVPVAHGHSVVDFTRAVLGTREGGEGHGASVVQLRAKQATTAQRVEWLRQMGPLCRAAGTRLLVDDDIEAALFGEADGVHLGQHDPGADDIAAVRRRAQACDRSGFVIGLSTHDLTQLRAAGKQGPDYLALGPIAPTRSKANPDPVVGMTQLLDGCRVAARPLVAIGGLSAQSGAHAIELGAAAVAVIGALARDTLDQVRTEAISLAQRFQQAAAPLPIEEVHRRIPVLPKEQLAELARWGDALGVHIGLGLPARFSPYVADGTPWYRPSDVIDLIAALGKQPGQSWEQWATAQDDDAGPLVQLRTR